MSEEEKEGRIMKRGVSLLEVLFSVVILSVGVLGIGAMLTLGHRMERQIDRHDSVAACGRALALADVQVEAYRSRESLRLIAQTVVDWALFLAVPGAILGVSGGWGILWPVVVSGGSGAILGLLYAHRVNCIRARGAEHLDYAWDPQRKRDELAKLLFVEMPESSEPTHSRESSAATT